MNPYLTLPTIETAAITAWTRATVRSRRAYADHMAQLEPVTLCRDCGRPATNNRRCDLHHRAYRAECSRRARVKKKETAK